MSSDSETSNDERPEIPVWLITSVFTIILVVCVAGNLTVILIVALRKDMHTVPNIFIASLSVSDLLIGLVALTLTIIQVNGLMPYNKTSCLLPVYFESVAITASVYSLVAVTFDRYKAVVLATTKAWALKTGVQVVSALWFGSFTFSAKLFFSLYLDEDIHESESSKNNERKFCNLLIEEDDDDLFYRVTDFIVLFIIPIVLMTTMYCQIARRLWIKNLAITNLLRSKRRIIKFLVTSVVLFFFSWLPFYMIDIIFDSVNSILEIDIHDVDTINQTYTYVIMRFLFTVLAVTNSAVNPVVYAYFNQNFRMELVKIKRNFHCGPRIEPLEAGTSQIHELTIPKIRSIQIQPRT